MKGTTMLMLGIGVVIVGLIVFSTYRNSRSAPPPTFTPDHNYPTLVRQSPYHQVDYGPPQFVPDPKNPTLVKQIPAVYA